MMQGDSTEPSSSSDVAPSVSVNQGRAITTVTQATPTPGPAIPVSAAHIPPPPPPPSHHHHNHHWNSGVRWQEISSLVREDAVKSEEAVSTAMAATEEPMQMESQSENVMSSTAAVLFQGSEAVQVCRHFLELEGSVLQLTRLSHAQMASMDTPPQELMSSEGHSGDIDPGTTTLMVTADGLSPDESQRLTIQAFLQAAGVGGTTHLFRE